MHHTQVLAALPALLISVCRFSACHYAGEELTVSYLGREEFAPAGARQALLQERYGFDCSCARCQLEGQAPKQLQQQLLDTYRHVVQVGLQCLVSVLQPHCVLVCCYGFDCMLPARGAGTKTAAASAAGHL
jgi:hypothetical protein